MHQIFHFFTVQCSGHCALSGNLPHRPHYVGHSGQRSAGCESVSFLFRWSQPPLPKNCKDFIFTLIEPPLPKKTKNFTSHTATAVTPYISNCLLAYLLHKLIELTPQCRQCIYVLFYFFFLSCTHGVWSIYCFQLIPLRVDRWRCGQYVFVRLGHFRWRHIKNKIRASKLARAKKARFVRIAHPSPLLLLKLIRFNYFLSVYSDNATLVTHFKHAKVNTNFVLQRMRKTRVPVWS